MSGRYGPTALCPGQWSHARLDRPRTDCPLRSAGAETSAHAARSGITAWARCPAGGSSSSRASRSVPPTCGDTERSGTTAGRDADSTAPVMPFGAWLRRRQAVIRSRHSVLVAAAFAELPRQSAVAPPRCPDCGAHKATLAWPIEACSREHVQRRTCPASAPADTRRTGAGYSGRAKAAALLGPCLVSVPFTARAAVVRRDRTPCSRSTCWLGRASARQCRQ